VHPLEERIRYQFRDSRLLTQALTHPSVAHEKQKKHFDNQRLEFLGDARMGEGLSQETRVTKLIPDALFERMHVR
jgi:ribonuclease III